MTSLDSIIFFVSAVVAVFGATMMISQRNPVASVLYFVLSILSQAVLYIQLGALFLGAILVIVYAGAIMVLFLFVIMLLNLRGGEDLGKPSPPVSSISKLLLALLFTVELVFVIGKVLIEHSPTGILGMPVDNFGSVSQVATKLFTDYLYPFELTGVLLLVAVVGAVAVAKRDTGESEWGRVSEALPGEEQPVDEVTA